MLLTTLVILQYADGRPVSACHDECTTNDISCKSGTEDWNEYMMCNQSTVKCRVKCITKDKNMTMFVKRLRQKLFI